MFWKKKNNIEFINLEDLTDYKVEELKDITLRNLNRAKNVLKFTSILYWICLGCFIGAYLIGDSLIKTSFLAFGLIRFLFVLLFVFKGLVWYYKLQYKNLDLYSRYPHHVLSEIFNYIKQNLFNINNIKLLMLSYVLTNTIFFLNLSNVDRIFTPRTKEDYDRLREVCRIYIYHPSQPENTFNLSLHTNKICNIHKE